MQNEEMAIDFSDDELLDFETEQAFKKKSDTEIILEKIDDLGEKIDKLSEQLNKQYVSNTSAMNKNLNSIANNINSINKNVNNVLDENKNRPVMKAYSKEELYLLHESGHSYADLAKVTGLNKETVRYRINSYIASKNK